MEENISNKKLREFGLLFGFLLPIIFGWILPSLTGHSFRFWTLWISIPIIFLGVVKPVNLFIPYKLWMKIGFALGWINSRIILLIVFIFVLNPIAFIMKLYRYDPLRKRKTKAISYTEKKDKKPINLKRIF